MKVSFAKPDRTARVQKRQAFTGPHGAYPHHATWDSVGLHFYDEEMFILELWRFHESWGGNSANAFETAARAAGQNLSDSKVTQPTEMEETKFKYSGRYET